MSKADNMLLILWLLQSRKQMTAQQLSEELEIHIRTVYRYIDALCASGVPIIADSGHNGGYQLLNDFIEVPLFFNADEQKALVHAAKFAIEAGYPYGNTLDQAVTKLKRYSNEAQREAIDRHAKGFDVIPPSFNHSLQPVFQEIEGAVAAGRTLSMLYQKEGAPSSQSRTIDPYGLIYWMGKWYIVGFCHLRGAVRSFRVDRMQACTITDKSFERPHQFEVRTFFLNNLLPSKAPENELVVIRIKGHEQTLKDVGQHWFLAHTEVKWEDDGITFKIDKKSATGYLPYILLQYGKSIYVLEPQSVKERLVAIASDLHHYYQNNLLP
ncbi:DNA-binding transcriptional regulator [Pullulanibacillus camelliae]|uniref:DNA-binding transcriptional regulator n=1 Tax=Pullulanibacillus camelliae TaxID=1707096 RepID=A0A8J2VN27_9BACL|nr:YafY family protein [Pullulanibacillus camelliae]GGE33469.1 DNA-binding transcriptional regulator [Pullulanibacillus camelliae]